MSPSARPEITTIDPVDEETSTKDQAEAQRSTMLRGRIWPLRLATEHDAEAIRSIYNAEVIGSTATFDLEARTEAQQLTWIAEHQGAHPALVALDGEDVIGFGSLSPYRDRPAYSTTVEDSVYVASTHRGVGVGHAILGELVRLASEHGFHTVIARIGAANAASTSVHTKCGFVMVGIEREIGRKFGRWLDVAVMQKML
ncbi:MAG: GNAT family N-acetyltransferase [Acidimicrobiales bacterium]|jgi:phosphinothricin acetyltransferase|nr:N-acetyltransferase family protein [Actinomycetota bacterium]MDA8186416.1 GNAT family N-acetyltransferase [Actinomycetota bacterium]